MSHVLHTIQFSSLLSAHWVADYVYSAWTLNSVALLAQQTQVVQLAPAFRAELQPAWLIFAMQTIIAHWIFVLGSCFGSFLNVVIYRLPAGMSLGKPKSRCPGCETPLAARDNIPVFGWLLLRGKCRYCRMSIAARYPIIEALCGCMFLSLMFGELLTGAANLPFRHPDHFHINPGLWLVWFTKWDLFGIYLYHCCLLILVLATAMIGYDGHAPQRPLTAFGILTGLCLATMWPELRPVPAWPWPKAVSELTWGFRWTDSQFSPGSGYWTGITAIGFLDGIAGLAGAVICRFLFNHQSPKAPQTPDAPVSAAVATSLLFTGVFLGWQAVAMLSVIAFPILAGCQLLDRVRKSQCCGSVSSMVFCGLLFGFVLLWKTLDSSRWMIGCDGWRFNSLNWWQDWLLAIFGLFLFSTGIRILTQDRAEPSLLPK